MKTLKVKKHLLAGLYRFLKTIPPKDMKTVDEMKQLHNKILPTMSEELPEYDKVREQIDEFQKEFNLGKIEVKDAQEKDLEFKKEIAKLDTEGERIEVEVSLEDADFNFLFDLFNRHGKTVFGAIKTYLEFDKALNETNRQPKEKK